MHRQVVCCDRCGVEIEENPVKAIFEVVDRDNQDFAEVLHPELSDIDLCFGCAEQIVRRIKKMCRFCD